MLCYVKSCQRQPLLDPPPPSSPPPLPRPPPPPITTAINSAICSSSRSSRRQRWPPRERLYYYSHCRCWPCSSLSHPLPLLDSSYPSFVIIQECKLRVTLCWPMIKAVSRARVILGKKKEKEKILGQPVKFLLHPINSSHLYNFLLYARHLFISYTCILYFVPIMYDLNSHFWW